jgi:hypothetical protein
MHIRGSKFCLARSRSRCSSFFRSSSSTSFPSSTKNPPFEFAIFERSYSKYFPSRASRLNGSSPFGAVGDLELAETTEFSGRLLFAFVVDEEAMLRSSSRSRCLALADVH